MKELKKQVAIIVDSSGKCKYVGKVTFVNEMEYNRLINESNQIDTEKQYKKLEIQAKLKRIEEEISGLEIKIKRALGEE